jgi:hypothetical protein
MEQPRGIGAAAGAVAHLREKRFRGVTKGLHAPLREADIGGLFPLGSGGEDREKEQECDRYRPSDRSRLVSAKPDHTQLPRRFSRA